MILELTLLVLAFPLVFMFHDFEEIIFFKTWLAINKCELAHKFPNISKKFIPHLESISTSSFALAVAEEFILISILSLWAVCNERYELWFGVFVGFSIHILIHIIQWLIYRKYIPCIVTSFLVLPYCIYTFTKIIEWRVLRVNEYLG